MSTNQPSRPVPSESDMLTTLGYDLTVDEWIFHGIPCVLLYKDGLMDIYPAEEYTGYELSMLKRDSSYKSAWISIRYGSYLELQECMYEILHEGLHAISAQPPEMKHHSVSNVGSGRQRQSLANPKARR